MGPAKNLIADEQIQFVFIHLALPHPPGVYDRHAQQIRNGGSYLDNLALADRYLGERLNTVEATQSREHTAVVACSDHSWRIPIWKGSSSWTKEDERASQKGFDPRPVLLVHFPEQKRGITSSAPLNSLVQHKILRGMILGNIWDESQLEKWIAAQS